MEELRSIFTVIAVLVSFWSAYTARRLWYQANRPIVSATIKENSSGVGAAIFDLIVFNSGNRPATEIFIKAKKDNIDKILVADIDKTVREEIYQIFSKLSRIQILLNSSEVKTAFFGFSTNPSGRVYVLQYEGALPIEIRYSDLDGNHYVSKQNLYIRDSKGFGGSAWNKSN